MGNSGFDSLIQKLDAFIRKYYKNQLIKGSIYTVALSVVFFLSISLLEHFGNFGITVRTIFFYSFLFGNAFIIFNYIAVPLLRLYRFGKVISYDQAAEIIGNHFTDVKDKLLNALQLKRLSEYNAENSLILASIDQKTHELRPVPFTAAVNLQENRRLLKFALLPLLIGFGILAISPKMLINSTERIVSHGTYFEPQAPFMFNLPTELVTVEGKDFPLEIRMTGTEIPAEIFIELGESNYKLTKNDNISFEYLFKAPQKDVRFRLYADGYFSQEYTLRVVPRPSLTDLTMRMDYPDYLGMKDEEVKNRGDITVPQGTRITWVFSTRNTSSIRVLLNDTSVTAAPVNNSFTYASRLMQTLDYTVLTSNNFVKSADSVAYTVRVIPDLHPSIEVTEQQESVFTSRLFFNGEIRDDYGLRKVTFNYKKVSGDKEPDAFKQVGIQMNSGQLQQSFYHYFDTRLLELGPGDQLVYFFEVWDNDGVNGSKSARTGLRTYRIPTQDELDKKIEQNNADIKSDMQESMTEARDMQKEIEDFNKSILQKKELTWDDKKKLEDLLKKQKDLEEKIKETQQENEQNNLQKNEFDQQEERIMEKQKELEKLMEKINSDDLEKMLSEMEKMMDKLDKTKLQQMLDQMKLTNEDLEKELDRTLELFKQMEFDQKLQDVVDELKKLSEEQDKLSKETEQKDADTKKLAEDQKKLNDKFKDVREDIKKLQEMNEGMENKREMDDTQELQDQIEEQMKDSGEQLDQKQSGKSGKSQKQAKQKMDELGKKMEQMQTEMESEQNEENLEDLRQILDNLLKLSFDQESLMGTLKMTNKNNPQYKDLMKEQKKLKDDSKIIEDSLLALSKRMAQLESFVNREITAVKNNMDKSLSSMEDRQIPMANQQQQYAMTSINNLALLLSEALEQLQQQMQQQQQQQQGDGTKSCKKPGKSNPQMQGLMQRQAGLQQKMEQLGRKMGEGKSGKGQGEGEGEITKELVKLAAEQESIRKDLQQLSEGMDQNQRKLAQDIMKKMEENETDLLNKRITNQTIDRQKDITIKMMESEKAQREQEKDQKRESNEGIDKDVDVQQKLDDYFKKKQKEIELLKTIPPALRPYYRNKVSDYFNRF